MHLFEARFLELFVEAEAKHKGCVGQMLVLQGNGVASVTSLLEIEESRRQEFGVWAKLRCVGRVRLKEAEATDFGFIRAQVDLVTDEASEPVGKATVSECLEAHSACRELEEKLEKLRTRRGKDEGGAATAGGLTVGERVEWGHERTTTPGFETSLASLRDTRREMLCFRGLDAAPATSLDERVQSLWGATDEDEAEVQLLSFSAAACLGARDRVMALSETDTLERLQSATASFRETQRRLAAEVALADSLPDIAEPDSGDDFS